MSGNGRSVGVWKHRLVKKMKHRAEHFQTMAKSPEEILAWSHVIGWFDDILGGRANYKRGLNKNEAIVLVGDEE